MDTRFEELICHFLEETILHKDTSLELYHGSMDNSIHLAYHRLFHYMKDIYTIYSEQHWRENKYNDKIPLEYIEKHIEDIDWDWGFHGLSRNVFITVEFVEKHLDKPWHWGEYGLSSNPNMTIEFIERHRDKPWDYGKYGLSSNPCITSEFVERQRHKLWSWNTLAQNPSIHIDTFNQFIHNQELDRGIHIFQGLSKNPSITKEFIEEHIYKYWDFKSLSINPVIMGDFVEVHPNKPWNYWYGLSGNPSISLEYIEQHPEQEWNWGKISSHPDLTMEFVEAHLDKYWNWGRGGLSCHPNITVDFIQKHGDKPWDWGYEGISSNPNLTIHFIKDNMDKPWYWGIGGLLSNPFTREKNDLYEKYNIEIKNMVDKNMNGIGYNYLPQVILNFCV